MRKKDRYKAAQQRDAALREAGRTDALLQSELEAVRKEKTPVDWRATIERVRQDAGRPSSPHHQQAVVTLGALSAMGAV